MKNGPKYYIVEASALPEVFLKVAEAKRLLQTGEAATVNDADRHSQSAPDLVTYAYQLFFRLYRESVAVFSLALAAEFFAVKEFTVIPECASGVMDICVLINHRLTLKKVVNYGVL